MCLVASQIDKIYFQLKTNETHGALSFAVSRGTQHFIGSISMWFSIWQ